MTTSCSQWQQIEFGLSTAAHYANPYTDVDVYVKFVHSDGAELIRPAFWDGGGTWRVRFASPLAIGRLALGELQRAA